MDKSTNIFSLNYSDLTELVSKWNEPGYRADQIWQSLYKQLYTQPEQLSNVPKKIISQLVENFALKSQSEVTFSHLKINDVQQSSDGTTRKTLFQLPDNRLIEAVLMRYTRRRTLCISTQSGCAMGCVFCATGQMGFGRHLSRGEIVEQVLYYARLLGKENLNVTNIVMMGMGEPFHNYDETMAAIDILNDPKGMSIGARRFTISTVGLVPMIKRFANENKQINLAVSLHAAEDSVRTNMLPVNKRYPLDELLSACEDYVKTTKRRITFEWALIDNLNDTPEQANLLAKRLARFKFGNSTLCHVNAIPLNPTQKYEGQPTDNSQAMEFKSILEKNGIPCTIRVRRGIDIQAGCGQLAGKNL